MHAIRPAIFSPFVFLLLIATAASAQYVGVTVDILDGGKGVFTYNRACHAAHSGSRMCTSEEMLNTLDPPTLGSPGELVWFRSSFQPDGTGGVIDVSGFSTNLGELSCRGWTDSSSWGLAIKLDTGVIEEVTCTAARRVACCIPVPEPSASVTIPSGAAILFAMAKLRCGAPGAG